MLEQNHAPYRHVHVLANLLWCVLFCILTASPSFAADPIISEVKITGNRLVSAEAITDVLGLSQGAVFTKEAVVADLQKIYGLGFFVPKSIEAKPYQKADGSILLEYVVVENAAVTDVVVYGNTVAEVNAYELLMPLVGLPENANLLATKIQDLESQYAQAGYIIARVVDIDVDPNGRLKVVVDEGVISEIVYKGNNRTQSSYLDHLVANTKVNQPYNETLFTKDYRRIQGTGYYSQVTRSVRPDASSDAYVLEIELAEKKTTSLGMGAGINSSTGLFGSGNFALANIHGKGESLNINALIGSGFGAGSALNANSNFVRRGRYTQVGLSYTIPYFRGSDYTVSEGVTYTSGPNFTVDLSKQMQIRSGISASKALNENSRFNVGTSYNFIDITDRDRFQYVDRVAEHIADFDDVSRKTSLREARALRDSQIISGHFFDLSANYSYQNLDSSSLPRDGWRTRFGMSPSLGLADVDSFTKTTASITDYIPIGKHSSLIFNTRGGYNLLGTLPQFAKFRLGTTAGVRGYRQFSELGVGSKLLITTTELRTPIYTFIPSWKNRKFLKNFGVAAFADAGVIGGDIRLNRLTERLSHAASAGVGLRVNLPLVGALRFDIGFPIIQAVTGGKLYRFNVGPADIF